MTALVKSLFPDRFDSEVHPREIIRNVIWNRMRNPVNPLAQPDDWKYWTPAGPNVFQRKEVEINLANLPLIFQRFEGERVLERSKTGWDGFDVRQIDMAIDAYVLVTPEKSAEETLDEMAFYVEACMNGFNLGEYSAEALIASTEYETEFDNSQPIAVGRLMFEIKYHCPRLGIDFGLWDRDGSCIANDGLPVQTIVVRNNFGTETYTKNTDF